MRPRSLATTGTAGTESRGTEVKGVKALVAGHRPYCRPQTDGHWWRIDTGAGFWAEGRLTLLRIDPEPIEWVTVPVKEGGMSTGPTAGK